MGKHSPKKKSVPRTEQDAQNLGEMNRNGRDPEKHQKQDNTGGQELPPILKKKRSWVAIAFATLFMVVVGVSCTGGDNSSTNSANDRASVTQGEEVEQKDKSDTPAESTEEAVSNLAPGVDPVMGPQDWYNDTFYKPNHCVSQSFENGGLAMCMIMGTDMANDNTMLVGYIDQDKPGVQEHFDSWEERKGMLVDAFAEKVAQAKHDGEPRLQHVTDVRVIATGGEGLFSGWQEERELR